MNKEVIIVPKGIRYISEWREQYGYTLPDYPCIINKQITGCGFTEECIRNNENIVLCSPRKMLLENKTQQHIGKVYYAKNELENFIDIDKDLNASPRVRKIIEKLDPEVTKEAYFRMLQGIEDYIIYRQRVNKPSKILVTYDSFRIVKEVLHKLQIFSKFRVVVDEFQSIFTDSKFKSNTEMEFLYHLQGLRKLNFVSATPMIDRYLEQLDEFKDLPYIEFDWKIEDPSRLIQPELKVRSMSGKSLMSTANDIIQEYIEGSFEKSITKNPNTGELDVILSKELVIYVNSVKNICDIIRKAELRPEQVNILCSNTLENQKKINNSLKVLKLGKYLIGSVPLLEDTNKMFTFCTRTVYLGADFYSNCARSVVLSDANIECLAVDITLDLPQILGRQRLECNPWKNRAEVYVKALTVNNIKSKEEFDRVLAKKLKETENLLTSYELSNTVELKCSLASKYLKDNSNYKDDYVAINKHAGNTMIPVLNKLVMLSERRAFDIQQFDYADRFSIFATIHKEGFKTDKIISDLLHKFFALTTFPDKMKLLCESNLSAVDLEIIFKQIPSEYGKYYYVLGPNKLKSCFFIRANIDKVYNKAMFSNLSMIEDVYSVFKEGDKLTIQEIVNRLIPIYKKHSCPNKPKGADIKAYFEVTDTRKTVVVGGEKKVKDAFKLIKRLKV